VGAMSTGNCEHVRGQLALAAIDRLPDNEQFALQSHLDGCPECRGEFANLSGLGRALASAQPERVNQIEADQVPDSLRAAVLGSLETEVARQRRTLRRNARVRIASIAAVLVLFVGGGIAAAVTLPGSHHTSNAPTFALTGPDGAHGTVQLTAESWGTSLELHATGGSAGEILTVSMRAYDGSWWVAGSYMALHGAEVEVPMSCAVPVAEIDGVRVTNAAGQQIMWGYNA